MTTINDSQRYAEQLSALADNELDAQSTHDLLLSCGQDSQLMATLTQSWASYHTIGDVLRANGADINRDVRVQSTHGAVALPTSVVSAVTQEPVIALQPTVHKLPAAANDSVFRWKMVAGMAAVAAVGSILWATVGSPAGAGGAQLAQVSPAPPTAVVSGDVIMIRDPRLDDLLAAHKQFGGASALQQPAGFLRNATFQSAGR
jgi:sigma-E factor negative regulatory protein RseA